MEFYIRPSLPRDAEDIWQLRRMPGVIENIMAMPTENLQRWIDALEDVEPERHQLSAIVKDADGGEKCVGLVGITVRTAFRARHVGDLGIMVHGDYQNSGIGSALMEAILEIADKWLRLERVELTVFYDNQRAIHLYEKLGFQIEGRLKRAALRDGEYIDDLIMGRLRPGS